MRYATRILGLIFCVALSLAGVSRAGTEPPSAPPAAPPVPPTTGPGPLRLLPPSGPADPAVLTSLAGSSWAHLRPKDILGRGADDFLNFRRTADQELEIEHVFRIFRSVNDKAGAGWGKDYEQNKTPAEPASVEGPVLRYGEQQQTFVVVPGKALVLNALVPVGGKWYYAARQTWAKGEIRDEEMLFDFADDPTKKDEGAGTIEVRSGNAGKIVKEAVRFTLLRADGQGRTIRVTSQDAANRSRWAEILFPPGAAYGLVLDQPSLKSIVYAAQSSEVERKEPK